MAIYERSPSRADILKTYVSTLRPRSWSGSRADMLYRRRNALEQLADDELATWARQAADSLEAEARKARQLEARQDERFE